MSPAATNWALAAALALLLAAAGHLDTETPAPAEAAQAQQQAREAARRERAAEQLCIRTHGPLARHGWDADGHLVCSTGRAAPAGAVALAQGART